MGKDSEADTHTYDSRQSPTPPPTPLIHILWDRSSSSQTMSLIGSLAVQNNIPQEQPAF